MKSKTKPHITVFEWVNNQIKSEDLFENYSIRYLNESQGSKSISQAIDLAMERAKTFKDEWISTLKDKKAAEEFVRDDIRMAFPALRTKNGEKFILGATRIGIDECIGDDDHSVEVNNNLDKILKLLSIGHYDEYDRNLNGESYDQLAYKFLPLIKKNLEKKKEKCATMKYNGFNDSYKIYRIESFKDSCLFAPYTRWCVTRSKEAYNSYTGENGIFYFLIKKGADKMERPKESGNPLDEYGISMIAVSVDEDGEIGTCTSRWNHDNGGSDSIMDTVEMSKLIGCNFFEVFLTRQKTERNHTEDISEDTRKVLKRP